MPNFTDPYIDSKTGILRNLVGATTYPELRKAEGDIVTLAEISLKNIPHTVNLAELQTKQGIKLIGVKSLAKS